MRILYFYIIIVAAVSISFLERPILFKRKSLSPQNSMEKHDLTSA